MHANIVEADMNTRTSLSCGGGAVRFRVGRVLLGVFRLGDAVPLVSILSLFEVGTVVKACESVLDFIYGCCLHRAFVLASKLPSNLSFLHRNCRHQPDAQVPTRRTTRHYGTRQQPTTNLHQAAAPPQLLLSSGERRK